MESLEACPNASVDQSVSQSVSQSINQSINHLFTASAYHPMKKQACSKYVHVNITFTKKREFKEIQMAR